MDLWSNTNAVEIPSKFSPSLVLNLANLNFDIKISKIERPFQSLTLDLEQAKGCV